MTSPFVLNNNDNEASKLSMYNDVVQIAALLLNPQLVTQAIVVRHYSYRLWMFPKPSIKI